jgi:hypothetical protein
MGPAFKIWTIFLFSFSVFWVLCVSGYVCKSVRDRGGLKRIGIRSSEEGNGEKTRVLEISKSVRESCLIGALLFFKPRTRGLNFMGGKIGTEGL